MRYALRKYTKKLIKKFEAKSKAKNTNKLYANCFSSLDKEQKENVFIIPKKKGENFKRVVWEGVEVVEGVNVGNER